MGRLVARTDKMRNHGRCRTDVESAGDIFCLPVGHGHALMLAQVLRPGCHHEGFDISSRLGWIVEEAPSIGAIAQAQRSHIRSSLTPGRNPATDSWTKRAQANEGRA